MSTSKNSLGFARVAATIVAAMITAAVIAVVVLALAAASGAGAQNARNDGVAEARPAPESSRPRGVSQPFIERFGRLPRSRPDTSL